MLPLDYPPCWEFALRKNKMHPRYCASNVKERWKKLETLSECMKLAFVRKRSDQCSTKKIYLIVVFKTERKGATQVHPAVRSERRPLRNLLFVLTLGRLLDERLSWTPMSRGADNIFHWGKIHDYTRLHSRWLRYCRNVSLVWTRKPVPESWCLAIFLRYLRFPRQKPVLSPTGSCGFNYPITVVIVFVEPINDAVQFLNRFLTWKWGSRFVWPERLVSGCFKLPSFHLLGFYSPDYILPFIWITDLWNQGNRIWQ